MERRSDWYAHPAYYEAIFGEDTERELDFLLGVNARWGTGGKRFLEPACGAGRLIAAGARRGLRMVGYDASEAMLAHARSRLGPEEAARVRLFHGRMESFGPASLRGRVDLAFNLVSTFRYLLTAEAALAHLRCVQALLRPGGLYVLGFHLTQYERQTPERERWTGRVGEDRVVCNTREGLPDRRLRRSAMRNTLRVRGPGKDWRIETDWAFRTYSERQAQALFREAGLRVVARYDFDYDLERPKSGPGDRLDQVYVLGEVGATGPRAARR